MKNSNANIRDRRAKIIRLLQNKPNISLEELAITFQVSQATIRRDLKHLKNRHIVSTNYSSTENGFKKNILPEFDSDILYYSNTEEKELIAAKAAEMLLPGDVVYINSSSTALRIIKYIKSDYITIITNNMNSLFEQRAPNIKLILTGGEITHSDLHQSKICTTGHYAISTVKSILANVCILGVSGVSDAHGLSTAASDELAINREMINCCIGKVIVVADHRKIGFNHNYIFSPIDKVDCLITDHKSDPVEIEKLKKKGIEVIITDPKDSII